MPPMPPPKLCIIELKFCKGDMMWTKTIESYQLFSPNQAPFPDWASINGVTEIYYYKPENLVEATIIEEQ
jgi:hypothetical protein